MDIHTRAQSYHQKYTRWYQTEAIWWCLRNVGSTVYVPDYQYRSSLRCQLRVTGALNPKHWPNVRSTKRRCSCNVEDRKYCHRVSMDEICLGRHQWWMVASIYWNASWQCLQMLHCNNKPRLLQNIFTSLRPALWALRELPPGYHHLLNEVISSSSADAQNL